MKSVFQDKLESKCPKVASSLKKIDINSEVFIVDWIFTGFTRVFNVKITRVFWDIFLIFGDYYLLRFSYAIFYLLKKDLSVRGNLEEGMKFIRNKTSQLKLSQLVKVALRENKHPDSFARLISEKKEKESKREEN